MTGDEIFLLVSMLSVCSIGVTYFICCMVKDLRKIMPSKKKQIQELKEEVAKLQRKVDVLNFQIKNPNGKQVKQTWLGDWHFEYLDNDSIEYTLLPNAEEYKIKGNYIVDDEGNKYKFDKDAEILIKIEREKRCGNNS